MIKVVPCPFTVPMYSKLLLSNERSISKRSLFNSLAVTQVNDALFFVRFTSKLNNSTGTMLTMLLTTVSPLHPSKLVSTTFTVPLVYELSQRTTILLVVPPESLIPPVIIQLYTDPMVLVTEYVSKVSLCTAVLPLIVEVTGFAFTVAITAVLVAVVQPVLVAST